MSDTGKTNSNESSPLATVTSPKDAVDRNRRQQSALLAMSTQRMEEVGTLNTALAFVTEQIAAAARVERASVWLLGEAGDNVCCADLFESTPEAHSSGIILEMKDYLAYFESCL
jgi:hypothetical protein